MIDSFFYILRDINKGTEIRLKDKRHDEMRHYTLILCRVPWFRETK